MFIISIKRIMPPKKTAKKAAATKGKSLNLSNLNPFSMTIEKAAPKAKAPAKGAAAKKAAGCPRAGSPGMALARWKVRIAVTIWRRAAHMAHRCLVPLADPEHDMEKCRDLSEQVAAVEDDLYPEDLYFGEEAD